MVTSLPVPLPKRTLYQGGYSYRLVIPHEVVEYLGWKPGDELEFEADNHEALIIRKPKKKEER